MDQDWVRVSTRDAMIQIVDHAEVVGLANTEEFTFRSFFMAAAAAVLDKPRFHTEWTASTYSSMTAGPRR